MLYECSICGVPCDVCVTNSGVQVRYVVRYPVHVYVLMNVHFTVLIYTYTGKMKINKIYNCFLQEVHYILHNV